MILTNLLFNNTALPANVVANKRTDFQISTRTPGGPSGYANADCSVGIHQAKWNHAFTAAIGIISGSIKIVGTNCEPYKAAYLEFTDDEGNVNGVTIDNIPCISSMSLLRGIQTLAAITGFFLSQDDPKFDEVKALYGEIADALKSSGQADYELCLKYCDAWYFTAQKTFPIDPKGMMNLPEGESLTEESIKEMSRFSIGAKKIDFKPVSPTFATMKYFAEPEEPEKDITEAVSSSMPIIDRCKAGEFIVPYEWSDEDKLLIPDMSFLDLYIPNEDFEDALMLIKRNTTLILQNMDMGLEGEKAIGNYGKCLAFIGKPGTGKSTMIKALSAALQIPFYPCTTTRYSEEDEYQGKTKLDHSESQSAAFKFCETPFLKCFQKGGIAVLEEFNIADAGMLMGALGQAIEKPFIIEKDGYMPTVRHPLCIICFTCNTGTQGSQTPNEALFSRSPHVFNVEDPDEEEFIRILSKQTDGVTTKQIQKVYDKYRKIIDLLKNENMPELCKVLTLRHCLAALEEIAAGIKAKRAMQRALVNPFKVFAPEIVEDLEAIIDI